MKNRLAIEKIRQKIKPLADSYGFTLRPIRIGAECCTWIRIKDVIGYDPIKHITTQLISSYKGRSPDVGGDFDDINSRMKYAETRMKHYFKMFKG